ncbi:hypothetical protein [Pararhodobacter sp. CCB-MM2]|uniref:hypothetical protein n=1 Tax=Pararhodobacter sp. CCB-MM2 TaxID=1786003 RepID=UPI00082A1BC2|nr:hypothetical protein [Pararhodobacter sp. CCB-MM2]
MFEKFMSQVPGDPEFQAVGYGFKPAIELRREPSVAGELVGVDAKGNVVDRWPIASNDDAVAFLAGKKVALPRDYPTMHRRLLEVGATVKVPPVAYSTLDLARFAADDSVDWA